MAGKTGNDHDQEQVPAGLPATDPRLLAAMYAMQEEEIDLWEYWQVIWRRRRMILSASLGAALLAVAVSLLMPNIYRAEMVLAPASSEKDQGRLSSALGGLGGLASLAGTSLASSGSAEEHLAVLQSREFIWRFVKDKKLMPVLYADDWDAEHKRWLDSDPEKQPGLWDAYRLFSEGIMRVSTDKETILVTLSIDWEDAELAAEWANDMLRRLNDYQRRQAVARAEANLKYLRRELEDTQVEEMRQTLFELISQEQKKAMLANTQQEFAFRVLDAAAAPDKKAKPKRALIVVLATLVAGFIAVFVAFILEGIARRRQQQADGEGERT